MPNPFDDDAASYLVLANHEGQRSLWPASIAVPDGWKVEHGPDARARCLDHVNETWTDIRPASLVAFMDGNGAEHPPSR
jgi:MbtH protein